MRHVAIFFLALLLLATRVAAVPVTSPRAAALLEEVDQTVRKEFYDPKLRGVDWTAEVAKARKRLVGVTTSDQMYHVIGELLATLHTSHTAIFGPDDPFYAFIGSTFGKNAPGYERQFGSATMKWADPGFLVEENPQGVFVQSVLEGDTADKAGLKIGDRIVAVDGKPWAGMKMFAPLVDRKVALQVQRTQGGAPTTVTVVPHMVNPQDAFVAADRASARLVERNGRRIGYVHLWAFSDPRVYDVFNEVLHGPLRRAQAVVIDLRDGIGGDYPRLLYPLLPGVPKVEFVDREGRRFTVGGPFSKPLAVIINERARSAKELYAHALRKLGATLVGVRTEGAVTAGRAYFMRDGSLLYLAVSSVLVEGKSLEGVGVAPDIEVARPIPWSQGSDPQLERSLQVLQGRLGGGHIPEPGLSARSAPSR